MPNNEKAAPDVRTIESGAEKRDGVIMSSNSNLKPTTAKKKYQGLIVDLLPRGEENAVPSTVLADLTGAASVRELQKTIERERLGGALILSSATGGYFRPSDGAKGKVEINNYVRTLRSRALNTLRTIKAANAALKHIDGQLELGRDMQR